MSGPVFLLVHGWGFAPDFWDAMRHHMPGTECFCADLGFRGTTPCLPDLPPGRPVIAAGHSLGFLWLLHHRPLHWAGLIAINGFPRFTKAPDWPGGMAARPLERMISRLDDDPRTVTADFLHRCGTDLPADCALSLPELRNGLTALRDWDERCHDSSVTLALAGSTDPLVALSLSNSAFPRLQIHPGGHLLPLEDPVWCAEHCLSVMKELNQ